MTSVLPKFNLVTIAAAITPPHAAKFVFINILDTAIASSPVPIASCDPPLKPNQPSHNIKTPIVTKGIEDAAKGLIGVGVPDLENLQKLMDQQFEN